MIDADVDALEQLLGESLVYTRLYGEWDGKVGWRIV
jgi:hypothetical protein